MPPNDSNTPLERQLKRLESLGVNSFPQPLVESWVRLGKEIANSFSTSNRGDVFRCIALGGRLQRCDTKFHTANDFEAVLAQLGDCCDSLTSQQRLDCLEEFVSDQWVASANDLLNNGGDEKHLEWKELLQSLDDAELVLAACPDGIVVDEFALRLDDCWLSLNENPEGLLQSAEWIASVAKAFSDSETLGSAGLLGTTDKFSIWIDQLQESFVLENLTPFKEWTDEGLAEMLLSFCRDKKGGGIEPKSTRSGNAHGELGDHPTTVRLGQGNPDASKDNKGKLGDFLSDSRIPWAIAASLGFVALFLWSGDSGKNDSQSLVAKASFVEASQQRGGETEGTGIRVNSPMDGFVTIIEFGRSEKPWVSPDFGEPDLAIQKSKPFQIPLKSSVAENVCFFITKTPAGEVIRRWLDANESSLNSQAPPRFLEQLERHLNTKGHGKLATGLINAEKQQQ